MRTSSRTQASKVAFYYRNASRSIAAADQRYHYPAVNREHTDSSAVSQPRRIVWVRCTADPSPDAITHMKLKCPRLPRHVTSRRISAARSLGFDKTTIRRVWGLCKLAGRFGVSDSTPTCATTRQQAPRIGHESHTRSVRQRPDARMKSTWVEERDLNPIPQPMLSTSVPEVAILVANLCEL